MKKILPLEANSEMGLGYDGLMTPKAGEGGLAELLVAVGVVCKKYLFGLLVRSQCFHFGKRNLCEHFCKALRVFSERTLQLAVCRICCLCSDVNVFMTTPLQKFRQLRDDYNSSDSLETTRYLHYAATKASTAQRRHPVGTRGPDTMLHVILCKI